MLFDEKSTAIFEFWRASNSTASRRTFGLNRKLALRSLELSEQWITEEGLDCYFGRPGVVLVCETEAGLSESIQDLETLRSFGGEATVLDRGDLLKKVPCLRAAPVGGIFFEGDGHLQPDKYVRGLSEAAEAKGAVFCLNTEVLGFEMVNRALRDPNLISSITGISGADIEVAKVAVAPMGKQLRFAGTLELSGSDPNVSLTRVGTVWSAACRHIRGVEFEPHFETWRGFRPCSPDDLPYIGRLSSVTNLTVATGHGMSGISQSAVTGRLVSQVITGHPLDIDINPFGPERLS